MSRQGNDHGASRDGSSSRRACLVFASLRRPLRMRAGPRIRNAAHVSLAGADGRAARAASARRHAGVPMGAPGPEPRPGVSAVGPMITPEGHGPEAPPALDPEVQVVRFHGPEGLRVEVLAPQPTPVPIGDGSGIATVGLERGVGYRLRLSNITERPGVELFPVIEIVGHLHRPERSTRPSIPIRVVFTDEDSGTSSTAAGLSPR